MYYGMEKNIKTVVFLICINTLKPEALIYLL